MASAQLSTLQLRHVFGLQAAARDLLCYADEETVAFVAGRSVVLQAPDRSQRFIPARAEGQGITALAVCAAKKLLAVAERGAERASVTIFDLQTLKRRKVLTLPEAASKEFVSLACSSDGKYLLAQGGSPDWVLALWVWDKSKLVATVRTMSQPGQTAVQCLFQPGDDPQLVSVVGAGVCRLFRLEAGNALKPVVLPALSKREGQAFTCHAWLLDNDAKEALAVGTAEGKVLVVGEGEVKQALQLEGGWGVACMAAFGKGFVVGTDVNSLALIARESDSRPYRMERTFQIEAPSGAAPEPAAAPAAGTPEAASLSAAEAEAPPAPATPLPVGRVTALAASPADDGIALLTSGNQLLHLNITSGEKKGLYCTLQELAPGFHTAGITGLATCIRRPLVATCGLDSTIRVWNYQDKSCELVKWFEAEPLSLALHPTGYWLLAGFPDKLRLMAVLADDLRLVREFPIKGCRECSFSSGGQYFAAVNNNSVHVYSAYTCAALAVLRGHTGRVRSLWWSADDSVLVTAGVDGAVYQWRVLDGKRERDFVQKGWAYVCAVGVHGSATNPTGSGRASGGPTSIIAAVTDRKLRVLEDTSNNGGLSVVQEVDVGDASLTHVIPPGSSGRLLFAADEEGSVRAYKFPLTREHQSQRCSGGAVSRIAVNVEETLLFAATQDGCIFVFDVRDKDPLRMAGRKEGEGGGIPFSEEVLAGRGDIDDKRLRMAELEAQVAEVTAQNEYQLKLKDMLLNEKVRELTDKATAEAAAAKERYDVLLIDRNDLETQYEDRLNKAEEKYQAQLAALDGQYQQKIIAEMERYQDLVKEREALNRRWEEQMAALVEAHGQAVEEVKAGYEARLREQEALHAQLQEEMRLFGRECKELQRQTEEDADKEVEDLKEKWQKQVLGEKEAALRLKGENGLLRKKFDEQQKAIDDSQALLRAAEADKRQLGQVIEGLRREIATLHKEVASRDDAIAEKEKRILDLKRKTQELEKFRFVLDYKISELKAQIDPKDLQLADKNERIQALEAEKQALVKAQQDTELAASEHRLRQAALQKEVQRQRLALSESKQRFRQVQRDIYAVAQQTHAPDQLKAAVSSLYQAHVAAEDAGKPGSAAGVADGTDGPVAAAGSGSIGGDLESRQLQLLEHTVAGLRKKVEDDRRSATSTQRRLVAENAELIREINELRREVKVLKEQAAAGSLSTKVQGYRPKSQLSNASTM